MYRIKVNDLTLMPYYYIFLNKSQAKRDAQSIVLVKIKLNIFNLKPKGLKMSFKI